MNTIEFFSGRGEFSKIAKKKGHKTFTIDNNPEVNPDLCKSILDLNIKDIPFKPDFIWASPPCIDYSHAKRTGVSFIELSNMMVIKTISLILTLKPKFWVIENPQTGTLKFQYFIKDLPFTDVSYCKYGKTFRKQTRLWNNFGFKGKVCNKDCESIIGNKHKDSVGNGRNVYTSRKFDSYDKGVIPIELIIEILNQCVKTNSNATEEVNKLRKKIDSNPKFRKKIEKYEETVKRYIQEQEGKKPFEYDIYECPEELKGQLKLGEFFG